MTARALLTAFLLSFLTISVAVAAPASDDSPGAIILCYHIVESPQDPRMEVSRETFKQQIRYLAMTGYNVIPLRYVYEFATGKRSSLPKNSVVITIDDGWRSTYTEIFPEMQKRNFPFTVFIYPKIIGQTSHALNWKQVKEMAEAGVDIQSHSFSHPFLTQRRHGSMNDSEYQKWLQHELADSKRVIERETGKPVAFIAYPYGDYDHRLKAAVAEAGYDAALTCDFGKVRKGADPLRMRRFVVDKRMDFAAFRHYLGAGEMKIDGPTPLPGQVVEPVEQPLVISAKIPNHKQIDPASVGMVVLSSAASVPFSYDAKDGSISMVVRDAMNSLKGQYLRALVWANDIKTGKRVEATWTFRVPDPALILPQAPGAVQPASVTPAVSEPASQPHPAVETKASTAEMISGGGGAAADIKGSHTRLERAPK